MMEAWFVPVSVSKEASARWLAGLYLYPRKCLGGVWGGKAMNNQFDGRKSVLCVQ